MKPPRPIPLVPILIIIGILGPLSGCSLEEPVIPPAIYQSANLEDRVWVYKATWQDTRALPGVISSGDLGDIVSLAQLLTSRLDRLDQGKAGPLRDRRTAELMKKTEGSTLTRTLEQNLLRLEEIGDQIPTHFDNGDFSEAKALALEALAISKTLQTGKN